MVFGWASLPGMTGGLYSGTLFGGNRVSGICECTACSIPHSIITCQGSMLNDLTADFACSFKAVGTCQCNQAGQKPTHPLKACSVSCVRCHDMHATVAGCVHILAYPDSTVQAAFISNQHVLKSRMTDLWEHPLQAAELWLHGRILAGQPVKVIVLRSRC